MIIYVGAIVGLVYRYLTTYILSKSAGVVIRTTWGYTSWHSILLSCAVFLIIKLIFENSKKCIDNQYIYIYIISTISRCSFGVYLIHKIVMYYEILLFDIKTTAWQWRTFGVLSTYLISLLIVYIIKKIPILRKIVP